MKIRSCGEILTRRFHQVNAPVKRGAFLAVALFMVAAVPRAEAQMFTHDFDTAAEFTENYRVTTGNLAWLTPTAKVGAPVTTSTWSIAIYDTDPGAPGYHNNDYQTETLTGSFFTNYLANSNSRMGFVTRVQDDHTGVLLFVRPTSVSSAQIYFGYGADVTASNSYGTSFYNQTVNFAASFAGDLDLTLYQTVEDGVSSFRLVVGTGETLLYDTSFIDLTATTAYNGAGAIGFLNQNTNNRVTYTHEFAAVPEPGSMALLGAGVGGLLIYLRGRVKQRNAR